MKTRVAIPAWQDRVSPVFDTASSVLVVDVEDRDSNGRMWVHLPNASPRARVIRLSENGVHVLLCGAVSRPLRAMLEAAGITVRPFLVGQVDELIRAFIDGRLSEPRFIMPGCCGQRRRLRRGRRSGAENEED